MKKYIKIMRLDHWIKQLFILPGCVFAISLTNKNVFQNDVYIKILLGFLVTSLIASANYVINEYLDAQFDRFHPTKKYRPVVTEGVNGRIVLFLWTVLSVVGFSMGTLLGTTFFVMAVWLWGMGIIYNVKPLRTKDIPVVDVLSESINNAIRLLMGWFIISPDTIPPCSIILGYWMGGAFLMATKRFAEYRMINNPSLAGSYRRSFQFYTEHSLIISMFIYAIISANFGHPAPAARGFSTTITAF